MKQISFICLVLSTFPPAANAASPEPSMVTLFRMAREVADKIAVNPHNAEIKLLNDLRTQIIANKHLLQFDRVRRTGAYNQPDPYEPFWRRQIREELSDVQTKTLAQYYPRLMALWEEDEPPLAEGLILVREEDGGKRLTGFLYGVASKIARRTTNQTLIAAIDIAGWPLSNKRLKKVEAQQARERDRREFRAIALASFGYILRHDCVRDL